MFGLLLSTNILVEVTSQFCVFFVCSSVVRTQTFDVIALCVYKHDTERPRYSTHRDIPSLFVYTQSDAGLLGSNYNFKKYIKAIGRPCTYIKIERKQID